MLSTQVARRTLQRAVRHAATASKGAEKAAPAAAKAAVAKAASSPPAVAVSFGDVKFKKENVADVMAELPEYNFYEMHTGGGPYPYSESSLNRSVLLNPPAAVVTAPKFEFSKLENGLKIASIDKHGCTAHVGLFVSAGSRWETASNFGVTHMTSLMAYKSTAHLSHLRTVKTFEQLGAAATTVAHGGREEVAYQTETLREFVPLVVPLLIGNVLFPRILPWEVKTAHKEVTDANEAFKGDADAMVRDMLHKAAYCNNTLGLSTHASERSMGHFTPETIRSYLLDHFAPERMVLVGVNVGHDELGKWAMRSFADYNAIPMKARDVVKAAYTGGDLRADGDTPFCHVAVGFEGPAFGSGEQAAASVLQAILGEGSAGSTGLAASGTSRLSTQLVRQSPYVESSAAFYTCYSDTGLFGVYSVAHPDHAGEVVSTVCKTLAGLSKVSKDELAIAKATLKNGLFTQADNASALVQDLGTQLLLSGTYSSASDAAKAIDSVTEAQVAAVAKKILSSKPSVAAFGDTHAVPHYAAIEAALK